MKNDFDKKLVIEHFKDDISKKIFLERYNYYCDNDCTHINEMINDIPCKKQVDSLLELVQSVDSPVFYGCGKELTYISKLYPDICINNICDMNSRKVKDMFPLANYISPHELIRGKSELIVITAVKNNKDIYSFLIENGFSASKILNIGEVLQKYYSRQYFDLDILKPRIESGFVDAGCFDAETSISFSRFCNGNFEKIYAFEPDDMNYSYCREMMNKSFPGKFELYPYGLWSKNKELKFQRGMGTQSKLNSNGDNIVNVVSVDEMINSPISFIKMDIEGSELEALIGAKRVIQKYHPRLAICVYHKPEDIIEIPKYILSLSQEYDLYLRHYHITDAETVLYAI